MFKRCSKCGLEKHLNQFNQKKGRTAQAYCRECQKKWYRKYYNSSNKEKKRLAAKKIRSQEELNAYIRNIKTNTPCTDCGKNFHFCAMDFDHVEEKTMEVSTLAHNQASLKTVKAEIDKCELVCSNCHRIRTYKRSHSGVA